MREEMDASTNRPNDGETPLEASTYTRRLVGTSRPHVASPHESPRNVSRVLLKLLANDVDGVPGSLQREREGVVRRSSNSPALNCRVTNYLGNNLPVCASRHSVINFQGSEVFDIPPFSVTRAREREGLRGVCRCVDDDDGWPSCDRGINGRFRRPVVAAKEG